MPENEETQQEAAEASDKLSCRTRLMGPLLMLGALVAVAQAKPAVAQRSRRQPSVPQPTVPPDRNGNCPPRLSEENLECVYSVVESGVPLRIC